MNCEGTFESIILCGGEAKRMKPYMPFNKAFAEVKPGITLLEHQVKWLIASGTNRVILAINRENYEKLKEPRLMDRVECSIEEEKLGTGGAVLKALERLRVQSFYVMNVDDLIISPAYSPLKLLKTVRENRGALGSVLLARARFPYGIVETSSNRVMGFRQKPLLDYKVCTGHYAFTKEGVMEYFPQKGNFEDEALQRMAQNGVLYSTELDGEWLTINNIKQLETARKRLIKH